MQILDIVYALVILFLFTQGLLNLLLSLYAWEIPERIDEINSPSEYIEPRISFSVLLPARNEKDVIGDTILSISNTNYPNNLIEIIVICDDSDVETIMAATNIIKLHHISNAKVVTYNETPINKPHGLNVGLNNATKVATVVFDAEDSVNRDIFNIANTLFCTKDADVIQAGVQLMNFDSRWFSSHNVLEYYFWFRSRMHFHTKIGMVPLGGNTVFFITEQLRMVGGWDQKCLTEDAEIGIRLSVNGAKIISTYDSRHITKEETPLTIRDFIKQRTRWNQGFMQILYKKDWLRFDSIGKRLLCLYTLGFPLIQSVLVFMTFLSIFVGYEYKLPVVLTLLSFAPLLIILSQLAINCLGLHQFTQEQRTVLKWRYLILMTLTFLFYQTLLSIGAIRATYRQIIGRRNWEKTTHIGNHRIEEIHIEKLSELAI